MSGPDPAYRACVGVAVFAPSGLVFVGRRANKALKEHVAPNHEWQMPQGGIDPDEDPEAAARRELFEETNIRSVRLIGQSPGWLSYDLPDEIRQAAWKGRYRGQTQKWFAYRFVGDDSEIDVLAPAGGMKPEFDAWRWAPLSDTPAMIIPFKRPVYDEVARIFAPFTRT